MTDAEKVEDWIRYLNSSAQRMKPWTVYAAAYRTDGEKLFLELCKKTNVKTLTDFVKLLV